MNVHLSRIALPWALAAMLGGVLFAACGPSGDGGPNDVTLPDGRAGDALGDATERGPDAADATSPPLGNCAADAQSVLRVHYRNPPLERWYPQMYLWAWDVWPAEKDVPSCGQDAFGAVFDLPRAWFAEAPGATMGFKFKKGEGPGGPWYEFDRAWTNGTDCWEVWVVKDDTALYCAPEQAEMPRIEAAYWDAPDEVNVTLSIALAGQDDPATYALDFGAEVLAVALDGPTIRLTTTPLDIQTGYTLTVTTPAGPISNALFPRRVLDGYVSELPLGALITPEGDTVFRVFAPRATAVVLHTWTEPAGGVAETVPLTRDAASGVWETTLTGNRHGLYYGYTVDGPRTKGDRFDPAIVLNDPYASIALTSHGGQAGRAMVFDLSRLGPATQVARPPVEALVAYEVHIRDLTGSANSGLAADDPAFRRYLGFAREGLRGPQNPAGEAVRTGLDHLVELGVNAVQLLPIHEFPADPEHFNWGYFTANFFSPEGMYASRADDETKALEFKALVDALHARGIAVILDVVFNHSAEGSELGPTFNFKGFDSKYYYRQDPFSHAYANGSGVGNELASERPMVRKFIVDCVRFWVERYGIDGFRFDLAALHDIETLRAVATALPDRYLYGEPWAAGGALWSKGALNAVEPWFVFNDTFRDTIKGAPEGPGGGFIQGSAQLERVKAAILGNSVALAGQSAWAAAPQDSLLYLDAHDNLTLADKLEVSLRDLSVAEKEARVRLAAALTLTSLGPIMLHAGVDFLRSKPYFPDGDGRPYTDADSDAVFDANSYASSDATNNLDWQLKADHFGVFTYFQGLLSLRASALGRASRPPGPVTADYVAWHGDPENGLALGYTLNADRTNGPRRLRVLLNASQTEPAQFALDFPAAEAWREVADSTKVHSAGGAAVTGSQTVVVEPLGARLFADGFVTGG